MLATLSQPVRARSENFSVIRTEIIVVTNCGRFCLGHKRINFSTVFPGQAVGIKEVHDIWLVSFMDYDLEYFDLETRVLEPLDNPFGPRLLPMSSVRCVTHGFGPGLDPTRNGGQCRARTCDLLLVRQAL